MRRTKLRWGLCVALFVALLVALVSCLPRSPELTAGKDRIHDSCTECHDVGYDFAVDGAFCLDCHNDYRLNHHPVDFVPPEKALIIAEYGGLPLFNGRIQCLTCHAGHPGPDRSETPKLLRGGVFQDVRTLCFRCHYQEGYGSINIHQMTAKDGSYRILGDKLICAYCHEEQPAPGRDQTYDVTFRADASFLCWRCHPSMEGEMFEQHFLTQPSDAMRAGLEQFSLTNRVVIPLVPRGKISCSTCHNPHQREVMSGEAARAGTDSWARLRLTTPGLCMACHSV